MKIINKKIIINLSSSRVSAGLVYFDEKKGKAVVDSYLEKEIQYTGSDSNNFEKNTIKALDKICIDLIASSELFNANFILDGISIFLSQPWVEYENYDLKDESFQNFELTNKYLNKFLFQNNIYEHKEIIRSDILSIRLNDYFVDQDNLEGKKVKKIEANFLDSYLPKTHKYFLEKIINTHFPLLKIDFYPFLPTLFSSLETFYGLDQDFLFLDFTAEILELGIFRDNKIHKMMSLPLGKNKIIASLMEKNNLDFMEAKSLLSMYLNDNLLDEEYKKVDEVFRKFNEKFSLEIGENLLQDKTLFRKVYAVSADLETRLILKRIKGFENVIYLDKNILNNLVIFKEKNLWDNFFALESKYIIFR